MDKESISIKNPGIIVVIPCFDDELVFNALQSLEETVEPESAVEVIVVVNSADNTPVPTVENNRIIFNKLKEEEMTGYYKRFALHSLLLENIPKKKAGVGYARKRGMELAVRRFKENNMPDGIIISLDADCLVGKNYFIAIEERMKSDRRIGTLTLQFQHDFNRELYSEEEISACRLYETYLRYYRLALRTTGFPYCFHTIGSCFAVRASIYEKSGGMPSRQGGEDFYFLHKAASVSGMGSVREILVYPSPRISGRVPFGTGPTVRSILKEGEYRVYNFKLFFILRTFFDYLKEVAVTGKIAETMLPSEIISFVGEANLFVAIEECIQNARMGKNLEKRLFSKFDAFFAVKFLNSFKNTTEYPPQAIGDAAGLLLKHYGFYNEENIYRSIMELDRMYS
jgi:glycosyltransferase involved in cell wall biosynthesis